MAKNLKYTFKSIFKNAKNPQKCFFFIENILRLTKHNLDVKRLHNFRKKINLWSRENIFRFNHCKPNKWSIIFHGNFICPSLHPSLRPVWYMCLKTKNYCLKIFVKIRVGEKVCENT